MIKVYGFPRSGNHLLMELIGRNFYPGQDLTSPAGEVGHWSDRAQVGPVEFGKLAGHHGPPSWGYEPGQSVYVYRDGRAVAASLYRSPHFRSKQTDGLTFSEWLRAPLDWSWSVGRRGGIGRRGSNGKNVIEHWVEHLTAWDKIDNLYWPLRFCNYAKMAKNPHGTVYGLQAVVFELVAVNDEEYIIPDQPVGHFPSGGRLDGWRELWSDDDEAWFRGIVPDGFYGVSDD